MKRKKPILSIISARSFKAGKARNIVAVIAIIMTTLMFTTLFVLSQSMSQNMVEMAFRQSGYDAHVSFKTITDEQIDTLAAHSDVKELGRSIVVGVAENSALSGQQVEMRYADPSYAAHSFAAPTTGSLPQALDEIALDNITLDRLGVPHEVGQPVTLEWRNDMASGEVRAKTFTLCGFWEGNTSSYASMAWVSRDFALEQCGGASNNTPGNVCGMRMAQVTLFGDENIEATMDRVLADTGLAGLEYGVNLAHLSNSSATALQESLPMYAGMLLVFVAGYLIIYNIFQISVTTDIQFYGKLKTLGATTKQIKRLIYGQASRLSIVGIPAGLLLGYLLGVVLVPVLIASEKASASTSPVIFIGSALFALVTIFISCLRPAKIAGKVSPMEALRYSDAPTNTRRKQKKSKNGASIARMGLANLGRNKKRTVLVICSLTLGLVLLSAFYAKDASFDMDKYLDDLTIADFEVADGTSEDYMNGYNPQGTTIGPALVEQIENLNGLEAMGRLYSAETTVALSEGAVQNIRSFYETDNRLAQMKDHVSWVEGYHETVESGKTNSVIFGTDGLTLNLLGDSRYLMDGRFDAAEFASGNYVMAVGIGTDDFSEQMPTFSVGDTVEIEGRAFTVMGIVYPINPIVEGAASFEYSADFIIPADTFQQLWPENTLRKLYFNVQDSETLTAGAMLTEYQQQVDSTMPITSRQSMETQYEAETRSSAVMGNAISIVIALVGVLNFVNSMQTAIISRKKEFAMLQSVGMTKGQLRRMLIFEGLDYAGLTLALSFAVSSVVISTVIRAMVEGGFTTYHFTLLPLVICTPIILAFAVIVPYICFRNLEKQSLVERLRQAD